MARRVGEKTSDRKKRTIHRILIVSEGKETEPNYFKSFKLNIERFSCEVFGLGFNTLSLVAAVEKWIDMFNIDYNEVFVVFDKDDFPSKNFNAAIEKAMALGYIPIWSNEAFELWFTLHFKLDFSKQNRAQYQSYLSKQLGKAYQKNMSNIRKLIRKDELTAISNAKKLDVQYSPQSASSTHNPCTKVYQLVERLRQLEQAK